jgi:dephospho-CoA kinase
VLFVGLTGGIGSGKSAVAERLARRGAVVIDADDLARRAVEAGTPGFDAVVAAFGPEVAGSDGGLDRARLAELVFADAEARRRLEEIVHPEVARLLGEAVGPYRDTDRVVVYDVPLLVERALGGLFDVVVTVEAPERLRLERLGRRGMGEGDARERMAAQASDAERAAVADLVLPNDGTLDDLDRAVEELWRSLERRAAANPSPPEGHASGPV